jgi:hypothetical protein
MLWSAVGAIWVAVFSAASVGAVDVEIGGLRNVRATVSREASRVTCKVSFIPVSCFDPAMNRMVNQQKAQAYALLALAKDVGLRNGTVSASDFHPVTTPVIEANRFTATYQADGIKRLEDRMAASDQALRGNAASNPVRTDGGAHTENLLSCLDDMRATLMTLTNAFGEQTAKIKSGDTLEETVAGLENSGIIAYGKLASEVKGQKLLLQIEKDDLLAEIKLSRDSFLRRLEGTYATLKKPDKS